MRSNAFSRTRFGGRESIQPDCATESDMTAIPEISSRRFSWQMPLIILLCGCLIAMIGFGARSGLGFFLTPMSSTYGWGRDVFGLALAIQMLLWGAAQPIAGAIADRYGSTLMLSTGAVLYAAGLAAMSLSTT